AALALALVLFSIVPLSDWWPWFWLLNTPWQLLGIAGLCLAVLAGSAAAHAGESQPLVVLAAVLTLSVLASYPYLIPHGLDYTPARPPLARYDDSAYLVAAETPALSAG